MECFSGKAKVTRGQKLDCTQRGLVLWLSQSRRKYSCHHNHNLHAVGETWERNFAGQKFRSYLSPSPRPFHCRERFSAFTYELEHPVENDSLYFPGRRGWFLGIIPLPSFLLPKIEAREYDVDGVFHFDVGSLCAIRIVVLSFDTKAMPNLPSPKDRTRLRGPMILSW